MDRPETIEAGQWWAERLPDGSIERPWRITDGHRLEGVAVNYWSAAHLHEYLGSASQPEPSTWLVETCARHAMTLYMAGSPATTGIYQDRDRWLKYVRSILCGENTVFDERVVKDGILSLAKMLRDLGRW